MSRSTGAFRNPLVLAGISGISVFLVIHFASTWIRILPDIQRYGIDLQGDNWTDEARLYSSKSVEDRANQVWKDAIRRNGSISLVVIDDRSFNRFAINHYSFVVDVYFGEGDCTSPAHKELMQVGRSVYPPPPRCAERFNVNTAAAFPYSDCRITSVDPLD